MAAARRPGGACARLRNVRPRAAKDRFGSSTDLAAPKFDFRSSPESGLKSDIGPCPFGATTGSRRASFDHLVGAGDQRRWHFDADLSGSFQVDDKLEFCWLLYREVFRIFTS
jgi:hypothetical protein